MRQRRAPRSRYVRLAQAMAFQGRRSIRFDVPPLPSGHRSLVTGGNRGIGAAVTDQLLAVGSVVVVAARQVEDDLQGTGRLGLHLDLGDLDDVVDAGDRLVRALDGAQLELVVLNAGIAPDGIRTSAQGHELAYAVNVLGHHVLLERLHTAGALADDARVVVVTGDVLTMARSCTADFTSDHPRAGLAAYARSKLGCLWLSGELARRHPGRRVVAVHPGVVRSGLVGRGGRSADRLRITPERSSEAVLAAALHPEVPTGGYLHNVLGLLELDPRDPATDRRRAQRFLDQLDELAAPWLERR